jgi:hypothetical protein
MHIPRPALQLARCGIGRRLAGLAMLALVLMGLAGCMRVQRSLTINGNGSGVYVLRLGFREPTPGNPSSVSANIVSVMDAFGAHVKQQGGSYRRAEDQGYVYWVFNRPFSSVSQAEAQLQDSPQQYDTNHTPLLYKDSLHVSMSQGLGSMSYHVSGTISLADPTGIADQSWHDATETLTITMGTGAIAHRGGEQSGRSVTYTVAYNQTATVDVSATVQQAKAGNIAALVLMIALVAFALAALGIWLIYRATHPAERKKG